MSEACAHRGDVDGYFGGHLPAARGAILRRHLEACEACRTHYQRHLRLAALDPRALPFEERVVRGLGLRPRGLPGIVWGGMAAALALSAVVIVARPATESTATFRARGAGEPSALVLSVGSPPTDVLAFRTDGGKPGGLLTGPLPARAEVAFAYRNGGGWQRLMVFARDDRGEIYWYQPPWTDGREDPEGVPLAAGPGLHELPRAVSHTIRGRRLELCALLLQQPLSVREVERRLALGPARAPGELLAGAGQAIGCRELEIQPGVTP
jgi:hypothetical protein